MPFVSGHKHDLFVSYAHAEAAWVEGFTKALCAEFQVRAGEPVTLWQDTESAPGPEMGSGALAGR